MATLKYLSTLGTGWQMSTISNGGSGYTSGATSIVVAAGGNFPTSGDFWVGVGDTNGLPHFIKRCTARSGNTLTVDAAVVAGTDQNESDGTVVQWVLPPEALDQMRADLHRTGTDASKTGDKGGDIWLPSDSDRLYRYTGSVFAGWGPIYPLTRPTLADYTQDLGAGVTASDSNAGIYITGEATLDRLHLVYRNSGAAPWTATLFFDHLFEPEASKFPYVFLGFRESASGKLSILEIICTTLVVSGQQVAVDNWTNSTTYSATPASAVTVLGLIKAFRAADNNTNRIYSYSIDGINFEQFYSVSRTSFLTADQFCFGVRTNNSASQKVGLSARSLVQG